MGLYLVKVLLFICFIYIILLSSMRFPGVSGRMCRTPFFSSVFVTDLSSFNRRSFIGCISSTRWGTPSRWARSLSLSSSWGIFGALKRPMKHCATRTLYAHSASLASCQICRALPLTFPWLLICCVCLPSESYWAPRLVWHFILSGYCHAYCNFSKTTFREVDANFIKVEKPMCMLLAFLLWKI